MEEIWQSIIEYAKAMVLLEFLGLIFGLLCVYFLIKEKVINFAFGIAYVLVSFFVFWDIQLYGDFILHIFFLVLNIYGWYYWVKGKTNKNHLPISDLNRTELFRYAVLTLLGILIFGFFLQHITYFFPTIEPSSLPYWDATTSIVSVTGMWLTAKKKIENWHCWLIVDILSTGLYIYKGIYFYAFLYLIYIFMAFSGFIAWRKTFQAQPI